MTEMSKQRQWQLRKREQGLCERCGKKPAAEGLRLCHDCGLKTRKARHVKRMTEKGLPHDTEPRQMGRPRAYGITPAASPDWMED